MNIQRESVYSNYTTPYTIIIFQYAIVYTLSTHQIQDIYYIVIHILQMA